MAAASAVHFHAPTHSATVHHVTATAAVPAIMVMAPSTEAEDDARTVAVIGVAAVTATVAIATMAVAVTAIVHRLH